tara:strand:+ start:7307 stop:8236 length:930 start_codon:yes stop_codon:yes gene_type:complete
MNKHSSAFLAALISTVLAPVCAFAQEVDGIAIMVTGERPLEPAAIHEAVRDMADEQRFDEPLLRFHDPICLSVSGLGRAASSQVRDRVLANARAASVPVADDGCRANALILVVDDPASLVVRIEEEQPRLISPAERRRIDAALASGEKVLVWHNEETRGAEGEALRISTTAPGMPVTGPFSELGAETRINSPGRAKRVGATSSRAIVNGVVILDIEHLVGMDLERVADFATMRLLAPGMRDVSVVSNGTGERDVDKPRSILAQFMAGRGAERMTLFDRAWLGALYDLAPNAASTRLAGAVAQIYASDGQ